jgi:hypothetical protein
MVLALCKTFAVDLLKPILSHFNCGVMQKLVVNIFKFKALCRIIVAISVDRLFNNKTFN